MSYYGYPPYVSVAQKQAKAAKKLKQLKKKMPDISPVILEGNTLARSWWAKSWNQNLERYADYSNRIGRGRSYLRHGAVLDLRIKPGKVTALVMGSTSSPYRVEITINGLDKSKWQAIKNRCKGQLKSLQDLLDGKFPKSLKETLFNQEKGLFPAPQTIDFYCSCPDSAYMCKHVAATLYGIGARFDQQPTLFFTLRKVDSKDLIAGAIKEKTEELLKKSKKKSSRVIDGADLSDIFGIDMDHKPDFATTREASPTKKTKQPEFAKAPKTATGLVAAIITEAASAISISELVEKTGYSKTKLYGIVHSLKQQGKIKTTQPGRYIKA